MIDFLTLKATKNMVVILNYVYSYVKAFQCHSNPSPQLFELKKKKYTHYLNVIFVICLS